MKINNEQRVYVIPCGDGYSCLGFDVCYDRTTELNKRMGNLVSPLAEPGSEELYQQYTTLCAQYASHPSNKETFFTSKTPDEVRKILERYRNNGRVIRIFLGDPKTGRDWLEESEVMGTIGRSMGPMRVPLLLEKGERGGGAIPTDCVLRIIDATTGKEVYRHPNYQEPEITLSDIPATDEVWDKGYRYVASRDGDDLARFKTKREAELWRAFMLGLTPWSA